MHTGQREGVDVLPVVAACHELLAKTDGVLALRHTVELLERLLRDALCAQVSLERKQRTTRDIRAAGSTSQCQGYRHPSGALASPARRERMRVPVRRGRYQC